MPANWDTAQKKCAQQTNTTHISHIVISSDTLKKQAVRDHQAIEDMTVPMHARVETIADIVCWDDDNKEALEREWSLLHHSKSAAIGPSQLRSSTRSSIHHSICCCDIGLEWNSSGDVPKWIKKFSYSLPATSYQLFQPMFPNSIRQFKWPSEAFRLQYWLQYCRNILLLFSKKLDVSYYTSECGQKETDFWKNSLTVFAHVHEDWFYLTICRGMTRRVHYRGHGNAFADRQQGFSCWHVFWIAWVVFCLH